MAYHLFWWPKTKNPADTAFTGFLQQDFLISNLYSPLPSYHFLFPTVHPLACSKDYPLTSS